MAQFLLPLIAQAAGGKYLKLVFWTNVVVKQVVQEVANDVDMGFDRLFAR